MPKREFRINKMDYVNKTFRLPESLVEELGKKSNEAGVSSNYRFTFIGEHLVVPNADKRALIEQCVLGMNNPNRIMDVSYDESVRFFSCVLLRRFVEEELGRKVNISDGVLGVLENSK